MRDETSLYEDELNSVMEATIYDAYYNFLEIIHNEEYKYLSTIGFIGDKPSGAKMFALEVNFKTYEYISMFLNFYHLGVSRYTCGMVFVNLTATTQEIDNAYCMEMQRLQYYLEENNSNLGR